VRLEAAAGVLQSSSYDVDTRVFQATFVGASKVSAPNLISIGATPSFAAYDAFCDGKPVAHDDADLVAIACGGVGAHTLTLVGK
jgi:hypothetical protein